MFSQSVTGLTEDPDMQALAQVLNTERMLPLLARVAGRPPKDFEVVSCTARVLNHKLGQRCTVRYTLTVCELERPKDTLSLIGKVYARPERAERLYRRLEDLTRGPFHKGEPLCIPAPLMLVQNLGLVLQEYVDAGGLRHVLSGNNSNRPLSLAGQWLARLHVTPPLAGLKTTSLEDELNKVERWCDEYIAPHLRAADAQRLNQAQETLHRFASETPPHEPVMIHKDFYHGNVLSDGQRVWALDFDELSIGDAALDLGHFLAHLEVAYRAAGRGDALAPATALFLSSYREKIPHNLESRIPVYRAYTFLKLAATEVSRKQDKWERNCDVLAGLACRELERPLDSA